MDKAELVEENAPESEDDIGPKTTEDVELTGRRHRFDSHHGCEQDDYPDIEETCATDIEDLAYSDEEYDYVRED